MSSVERKPKWWQLYLMMPLLVGLFWPEMHAQLTETEHVIAELGILLLIFGFVHVWLRANRSALMRIDPAEAGWRINLYEVPFAQLRALEDEEQALRCSTPESPGPISRGAAEDPSEQETPRDDTRIASHQGMLSR